MTDKMIVLADLGHVKAFRVTHDMQNPKPHIELSYECEFPEAHIRLGQTVTDQAGRFAQGNKPGSSTWENHNLRAENERRLLHQVAEKISELVQNQRTWYLAAAESVNSRLVELLNPAARATMVRNIASDLVKIPKDQILGHFATA
jgi:hypothetical protein